METASPYEGHTSRTFFVRLLTPTSGLLRHTSGLPKILPRLRLTLLTTLGLWGVPYERSRQDDAPRTTPTYYPGGCVYVRCQSTTPRWGVTCSGNNKEQLVFWIKTYHVVQAYGWEWKTSWVYQHCYR